MKLFYDWCAKEVEVGDVVENFKGDQVVVRGIVPPKSPNSTGRVRVQPYDPHKGSPIGEGVQEFYPAVIRARWVGNQ